MPDTARPARNILLVDDEEDLAWSLKSRLTKGLPDVVVEAVTSGAEALEKLSTQDYSLVISDIRMPRVTGIDLLIRARQRSPGLPFIVMTAFPSEQSRTEVIRMGSVQYLEKPFELPQLLAMVDQLLRHRDNPGFSGAVSMETLPDLVQLFSMSATTGALRIWQGTEQGAIWFDRGAAVHAETRKSQGTDAFYEIVSWAGGRFAMERNTSPTARTIAESSTALLMEALRRLDESRRAGTGEPVPVPGAVSVGEEFDGLWEEPAEPAASTAVAPVVTPEPLFEQARARLEPLSGFLGLALVEIPQAEALSMWGDLPNLQQAARANAGVVASVLSAYRALVPEDPLEDLLFTLDTQYHLLRPLGGHQDLFFFLVLDRATASLGMARLALEDAARPSSRP